MNEIIPGILETEWSEIEKKLELIKPFAKTVHIDIIDGKFAPHTTFLDPEPFKKYRDDFLLELHMMVDNPIQYLQPWADAGFERFLGHVEMMPDINEFIGKAQELGTVGLAVDGPTSLDAIKNINLNNLDCMLIMTIKAGESGRPFDDALLEKVRTINKEHGYLPIEVDGGINRETVVKAKEAGANRFVTTSHLFKSYDIQEEYQTLSSLIV